MKVETKKTIEWIKNILEETRKITKSISEPTYEDYKKRQKDATAFLDSLPEIESRLCRGGYIQDKNGTPCCEGDRIKIISEDGDTYGTLLWNSKNCCFDINIISTSYGLYIFDSFEKVEK